MTEARAEEIGRQVATVACRKEFLGFAWGLQQQGEYATALPILREFIKRRGWTDLLQDHGGSE